MRIEGLGEDEEINLADEEPRNEASGVSRRGLIIAGLVGIGGVAGGAIALGANAGKKQSNTEVVQTPSTSEQASPTKTAESTTPTEASEARITTSTEEMDSPKVKVEDIVDDDNAPEYEQKSEDDAKISELPDTGAKPVGE